MRVVMITGGSSGIGAALADAWRARGATVVATDVKPGPGDVFLDVTDAQAVRDAVNAVVAEHGRIDVLHNNAGIQVRGTAWELTDQHWDKCLDINLRGVIHGVTAALPHMVAARSGQIVNTASMNGLVPLPGSLPYTVTKHAVVALTRALRVEMTPLGIGVTALCPGAIDTPLLREPNPGMGGSVLDAAMDKLIARMKPMPPEKLAKICVARLDGGNPEIVAVPWATVGPLAAFERFAPKLSRLALTTFWAQSTKDVTPQVTVPDSSGSGSAVGQTHLPG